ncbi:hypothetical protein COLINT_03694 [Collinsella intestinalis DSM 13280]|uniref:Uncharacterized protein n=1 Tax=Collinsella intestinalis DSM 13280 TaxID=521003 RepID=C4FC74_9ACTN|nr:hypothetical protein COLINT_03694 [Collinsella intestinalis DSM 13280]
MRDRPACIARQIGHFSQTRPVNPKFAGLFMALDAPLAFHILEHMFYFVLYSFHEIWKEGGRRERIQPLCAFYPRLHLCP